MGKGRGGVYSFDVGAVRQGENRGTDKIIANEGGWGWLILL